MAQTAFASAAPLSRRTTSGASRTRRPRTLPQATLSGAPSRRALLRSGVLAAAALALPGAAARAAPKPNPNAARDAVTTVAMCLRVLAPVERYVREGAWDRARTNVNYCSRVLAVRPKMLGGADTLVDDEAYLSAMEAVAEVPNLFTMLDAALYTAVFIPADDGQVVLEQRQYQEAAWRALDDSCRYLVQYLDQFPSDMVATAKEVAGTSRYEIKVEAA